MAIISVRPKKDGVTHSADLKGRSYSIELLAEVSDNSTGPKAIRDWLAAAGYLAGAYYRYPLGTPTEIDYGSFLQRVSIAHNAADGLQYRVTLEYNAADIANDGPAKGDGLADWKMAPTLAPPSLKWSSEDIEFACTHDRTGQPILNKAGDPFDPPVTIFLPTPIANVSRVESAFLSSWITAYKGTVNQSAWMGFPAESVLCKDITADRSYDADNGYLWTVNYTFAFRPSVLSSDGTTLLIAGWDVQVLNAGKREKKSGVRSPVIIDGAPVSDPVPLKADGTYDAAAAPNYLRFAVYPKKDFEFFNFPADLFDAA